jgi:multidrug resistance efflux pump
MLSIAQTEEKMNIDEIVSDLSSQIQQIEDAKTALTEAQQELRQTIVALMMQKEEKHAGTV